MREDKIFKEVQKVFDSMTLEPKLLQKVISIIKSLSSDEQEYHNLKIKELNVEYAKIKNRMDRLTDIFLDGDIDKDTHEDKRKQLVKRRSEILAEIKQHNNCDNNYQDTLIRTVHIASNAGKTFRGSTTEEKRELINMVLCNLRLKGQKLEFKLRPPFDYFLESKKSGEWRTREESNP